MLYIKVNFYYKDNNKKIVQKQIYKIKNMNQFYKYLIKEISQYLNLNDYNSNKVGSEEKNKRNGLIEYLSKKVNSYLIKKQNKLSVKLNVKLMKKIFEKFNGHAYTIKIIKKPYIDIQ